MKRVFVRGDCHGDFSWLPQWCENVHSTYDDYLIILGDAGINYYLDKRDKKRKEWISSCAVNIISVQGNHEERPRNIESYNLSYLGNGPIDGYFWIEENYPNIMFPDNGDFYLYDKRFLVADGAYSADKFYRLSNGWSWFEDEQMNDEDKKKIEAAIKQSPHFDFILSHTCPRILEPIHLYINNLDQKTVDKTTEDYLQEIYNQVSFGRWYFGHFHSDETNGLDSKVRMKYKDIERIL